MSRRCKPSIRARIIVGSDTGKIVLVVRPYLGEVLNNARWPEALFPWVVTSLGSLLRSRDIDTGIECPPARTIVVDDCDLEPLDDDDQTDWLERDVDRPIESSTPNKGAPAPVFAEDDHG